MHNRVSRPLASAVLVTLFGQVIFADPIIQQGFDTYPTDGPAAAAFGDSATTEGRWFSTEVNTGNGGVFAITNAQAHSGSQSLLADRPSGAWATSIGGRRFDGTPTGAASIDTAVPSTFEASVWMRRATDASTGIWLTSIFEPYGPTGGNSGGDYITGVRIAPDGQVLYLNDTFTAWESTNGNPEVAPDTWTQLRMRYTLTGGGAGTIGFYVKTDSVADHFVGSRAFTGLPAVLRNFDIGPSSGALYYDDFVLGVVDLVPKWNIDASGDWNVAGNWANNTVPNAPGAEASFLSAITAAHTVYTDIGVTAGNLTFNNANSYVIGGAGSLTLEASSGSATISVVSGSHKINLPFTIASDASLSVAPGSTLTLGNPTVIKANKTVALTGAGSLVIQAPLSIEAGGTLSLGPAPASLFSSPSLATGARINVGTQSLSIDYRGQPTPASAIKAQLTSGYANGAWSGEGIMTSAGASDKGLGWKDDSASQSIQVKYTYLGDANLSGTVDSLDFNAFIAGYGQANGVWTSGDFNYDGKVNTQDFNYIAGNFNRPSLAPSLGAVVPEPVSGATLTLAACLLASRRRTS